MDMTNVDVPSMKLEQIKINFEISGLYDRKGCFISNSEMQFLTAETGSSQFHLKIQVKVSDYLVGKQVILKVGGICFPYK